MNEDTESFEEGGRQVEAVTGSDDDAAFDIYRDRILGGDLFLSIHPQISLLKDNDQTIVATMIFDDTPQAGNAMVRSCNIFDMSLMTQSLAEGMLRGLEGMDKSRGRILSMPGEREYNINTIKNTIAKLEEVARLVDILLKD